MKLSQLNNPLLCHFDPATAGEKSFISSETRSLTPKIGFGMTASKEPFNNVKLLLLDPKTDVNSNIPNIGLAYAATYHKARVIDQHILPYPRDRFLKVEADVLGISVKSFTEREAERARRIYSSKFPKAAVRSVTGFVDVQCCYPYIKWEDSLDFSEPFSDSYPFPDYELFDSYNYLKTKLADRLLGVPYNDVAGLSVPVQLLRVAQQEVALQERGELL